jgi:hypothetical protein
MAPMGGALLSPRTPLACALAGLAVLAAAPAALAHPAPFAVTKTVKVATSGVTTLTVRCPHEATALAGAVVSTSTGVTAGDSQPTESDRWVFRFTALAGSSKPRATAQVRCLRLDPEAGVRHWKVGNFTGSRTVKVAALSSRKVRVRCQSGYLATGYGIAQSAGGPGQALPSGDVRVASAVPARASFTFRLENTGGDTQTVDARVRCLARQASAKRSGQTVMQTFAVDRAGFSDTVSSGGTRRLGHRCPGGHYSLAAGLSLSANDDIFLTNAHPAGRRAGTWIFNHPAGQRQPVRTFLTCLSLQTSFR